MDVPIEFRTATFAFRNEVEADATDMLLGTEVFEVVDFLALDFEFQQAKVL